MERVQIKCPAKPVKCTAMDAEERFQQKKKKKTGYIKYYLSEKHEKPLAKITLNSNETRVSTRGKSDQDKQQWSPQIQ